MNIMCDYSGTLERGGIIDVELAQYLLKRRAHGDNIIFVTQGDLRPFNLCLCEELDIEDFKFRSRSSLSEWDRNVDVLIDDEATLNTSSFKIATSEVTTGDKAIEFLEANFPLPGHAPEGKAPDAPSP